MKRVFHTITAILVLAALPAAWVPPHMACHHAAEDAAHQAPIRSHCAGMNAGVDAPGWDQARCCGGNGLAGLCCLGRESSPVVSSRSIEAPSAQETISAPATPVVSRVVPTGAPRASIPGSGDLPPPGLHRYRDLSVLRL